MNWIIQLIIFVVSLLLSAVFASKVKTPKPEAAQDMENPTAESGRPIPVVFGEVTIKSPNVLWYGDKEVRTYKVK